MGVSGERHREPQGRGAALLQPSADGEGPAGRTAGNAGSSSRGQHSPGDRSARDHKSAGRPGPGQNGRPKPGKQGAPGPGQQGRRGRNAQGGPRGQRGGARASAAGAPGRGAVHDAQKPPTLSLPATNKETLKRLRRERSRRLAIRFGTFVLLPTLLAAVYYGFLASNQYESYATFTVHSAEGGQGSGLTGLLGGAVGALAIQDIMVVHDHIQSRDMLAQLDEEHGLTAHFKDPSVDWLSRLDSDATLEEAYEDFEDMVDVEVDSTSGNMTLRVRAFSPQKAQEIAEAVIAYSEAMVNELSERERKDRIEFAETEVAAAEARLSKARQDMLKQQRKHAEINPEQTAASAMTIRTQLEAELARARARLMEAKSYMKSTAPKVRALRDRVKALSAQVGHEKSRLVDTKGENGLADTLAEFEEASVEKEFAQRRYASALTSLEMARTDAARKHRYLALIAKPSLPDASTYPERAFGVFTVFAVSFLLLGIGSLLFAAIREHAQV